MKAKLVIFLFLCFVLCLGISGCGAGQPFGPTITPTPTNTLVPTPTDTPTFTPTATLLPSPTITDTPETCQNGGSVIFPPVSGMTGTINDKSCSDVWTFTMDKGAKLVFTMTVTSGNLQPFITLVTSASDSCTSCEGMTVLGTSEIGASPATFTFTLPYSGDYYAVLQSTGDSSSGTYAFSVEESAVPTALPKVIKPTVGATKVYRTATPQNPESSLGTVPVTITNNTSHEMKIVAVGPEKYTVDIMGGATLDVQWAPGNYTLTAYYENGEFYASTSYAVNENHAIFTLN